MPSELLPTSCTLTQSQTKVTSTCKHGNYLDMRSTTITQRCTTGLLISVKIKLEDSFILPPDSGSFLRDTCTSYRSLSSNDGRFLLTKLCNDIELAGKRHVKTTKGCFVLLLLRPTAHCSLHSHVSSTFRETRLVARGTTDYPS